MKTGERSRQSGRIRPEGLTGRATQEIRSGGGAQPLRRTDREQVALAAGGDKAGGRSGNNRQRQELPRRLGNEQERAADRQDEADHERRPATDTIRHYPADQGEDGATSHLDRIHGRREAWRLPEKPVHVGREERLRRRRGDAGGKDEADEDDGARRPERRRGLGVAGGLGRLVTAAPPTHRPDASARAVAAASKNPLKLPTLMGSEPGLAPAG